MSPIKETLFKSVLNPIHNLAEHPTILGTANELTRGEVGRPYLFMDGVLLSLGC
jgi:hypothetical protein